MKKLLVLSLLLILRQAVFAQCNPGLRLGAVIVPTHGNAANNGNFTDLAAWQEAAGWMDSLQLDYRQPYITWTDVVTQINNSVPVYNNATINFQNQINAWAGRPAVHVVYSTTKVGVSNTLEDIPAGFGTFTSFLDTAYINQNYNAIKHIVQYVEQVQWLSIGNEIDAYFGGTYFSGGRLGQYAAFLDTMRTRLHRDFPNIRIGTIFAFHNLMWSHMLSMIDSVQQAVDYMGYTFYYTATAAPDCWGDPATVQTWLDTARIKAGGKPFLLTETCMGDGGGILQNCGSPVKQLAYGDTLLRWYAAHASAVEGMTWFTITDPYLGWQTPSTLWNTCGLIDSSGTVRQPASMLWNHVCPVPVADAPARQSNVTFSLVCDAHGKRAAIRLPDNLSGKTRLTVYRMSGTALRQLRLDQAGSALDVSNYPRGVYLFKIENAGFTALRMGILL